MLIRPWYSRQIRDQLEQLGRELHDGTITLDVAYKLRERILNNEMFFQHGPLKYTEAPPPPRKRVKRPKIEKLTLEQVREMRERHENGEHKKGLAIEYGVTATHVHNIVTHRLWSDTHP